MGIDLLRKICIFLNSYSCDYFTNLDSHLSRRNLGNLDKFGKWKFEEG